MLSRVQICKKYHLQPITFDAVAPLLKCEPVEQDGRVVYNVTPHDDFVFTCARLHPASYAAACNGRARLYPFHRFLLLKFLTVGLDELLADIEQRGLAPGLGKPAIKYMQTQVYALMPPSMRGLAKKHKPPTHELTDQYKTMLRVIGIDVPYDHPTYLDEYFPIVGDPDLKVLLEAVMTTYGRPGDWQDALVTLARFQWTAHGLDIYSSIFYDRNHLSESDWKHYLGLLPPAERRVKSAASELTTAQLCAHEAKTVEFTKTMRAAAYDVQMRIMKAMDDGDPDFRRFQSMLVTFNSLGKATGETAEAVQRGGFFRHVMISTDDEESGTIEDIQEENRPPQIRTGT